MTSNTEAREALPAGLTLSEDGSLLNWRGENYVIQRPPLPAPSDDEREAIAMIVKRTNAKWAGPSMAEFANDPPTRTHYSIADQVLAYLAARRSPVQADTPSDEEIAAAASIALPVSGATQSGTAVQSGRNFRGAERVAFAAGARWALASRPTPPEDVAALQARIRQLEGERAQCDGGCDYNSGPEETCSLHGRPVSEVWEALDIRTKRVHELEGQVADLTAALAARQDTASQSPSGLELPVETPSAVGTSEGVTDDALLATLEEHYLVPQEDLDRDYERASLIRGLRAVAALAARPLPETEEWTAEPDVTWPADLRADSRVRASRALIREANNVRDLDGTGIVGRLADMLAGWLPVQSATLAEGSDRADPS